MQGKYKLTEELKKKYFYLTNVGDSFNCNLCRTNISIANEGNYNIKQHLHTKKHKTAVKDKATLNDSFSNLFINLILRTLTKS